MGKKITPPIEFYSTLEHAFENFTPHEIFYIEYIALKLYDWLYEKIPIRPTILDIGCGHGILARLIQILFEAKHTYGIDIAQEAISYAQKTYKTITFKHVDKVGIPFSDNMFDIVYANLVFHHIPQQDHVAYITEINRVLKPGGIAVIVELNQYNLFTRHAFKHDPHEQGLVILSAKYIKKLMQLHGKTSVYYFGFFQQWFRSLRSFEPCLSKIPLGSLYAIFLHKYKNPFIDSRFNILLNWKKEKK